MKQLKNFKNISFKRIYECNFRKMKKVLKNNISRSMAYLKPGRITLFKR